MFTLGLVSPSVYLILSNIFIRVKLVRIGHPARLLPQVVDSALDAQVHTCYTCHGSYLFSPFHIEFL